MEKVSIIIPTYNREQLIMRAVNSVLEQSYQNYELLIVDDGSTDNTRQVLENINDTRVKAIFLEQNQGVAHARNTGIAHAAGSLIAFLDSDDEWLPGKLEKQVDYMCSAPQNVGMVYCRMGGRMRDSEERFICPADEYDVNRLSGEMFLMLANYNVIGMPTIMVRRECLEKVGVFHEKLICLEDWELFLRIARQYQIGFLDERLVEIHKTAGSVSANAGAYVVSRCYMLSLYYEEIKRAEILESIVHDIMEQAQRIGLMEETKELLKMAERAPLNLG